VLGVVGADVPFSSVYNFMIKQFNGCNKPTVEYVIQLFYNNHTDIAKGLMQLTAVVVICCMLLQPMKIYEQIYRSNGRDDKRLPISVDCCIGHICS